MCCTSVLSDHRKLLTVKCLIMGFCFGKINGAVMKLKLAEELWRERDIYVSYCPELDMASCGETFDQAKKNLKEVILINLEEAQKLGTLHNLLQEAGLDETQDFLCKWEY